MVRVFVLHLAEDCLPESYISNETDGDILKIYEDDFIEDDIETICNVSRKAFKDDDRVDLFSIDENTSIPFIDVTSDSEFVALVSSFDTPIFIRKIDGISLIDDNLSLKNAEFNKPQMIIIYE